MLSNARLLSGVFDIINTLLANQNIMPEEEKKDEVVDLIEEEVVAPVKESTEVVDEKVVA